MWGFSHATPTRNTYIARGTSLPLILIFIHVSYGHPSWDSTQGDVV